MSDQVTTEFIDNLNIKSLTKILNESLCWEILDDTSKVLAENIVKDMLHYYGLNLKFNTYIAHNNIHFDYSMNDPNCEDMVKWKKLLNSVKNDDHLTINQVLKEKSKEPMSRYDWAYS